MHERCKFDDALLITAITTYIKILHSFPRVDGCPRETRTLILGGISYHYTWQEVEIGITLSQPCPCQDLLGPQSGSTFRQCTGAYSNGGSWSQVDFTQCAIFVSEATRHLCENAVVCKLLLFIARLFGCYR